MNYHQFIYSVDEMRTFFEKVLLPLNQNEVFFISLSARNKYLSVDERQELGLGRTEMFSRNIIREYSFERFLKTIRRYECHKEGYLTKKGLPIPSKCIVVYLNINPTCTFKAFNAFQTDFNSLTNESLTTVLTKRVFSLEGLERFKKLDIELLNNLQRERSKKHYIDIDFDLPIEKFPTLSRELVKTFVQELDANEVKNFVIETKGGFHVLLKRDTIKYNFNESLKKVSEKAKDCFQDLPFEIVNNKNEMVPLPGTLQAGFEVKMINFEGEE